MPAWLNCELEEQLNVPDAALERFFDEAEELPETYPFLAVVTKLIQVHPAEAYQKYL